MRIENFRKHNLVVTVVLLLSFALGACGQPAPTSTSAPPVTALPTTVEALPTDTPAPTVPPPAEPTATPEPTQEPKVAFEKAACPFEMPTGQVDGDTVECGYMTVAEDRTNPQSRSIRILVATFRNPSGNPEPDPIVYLEGGPGGSALEFINLSFSDQFEPLFAANRDIVIFDQRGVGYSTPTLDCPNLDKLEIELLDWKVDGKQVTAQEANDLVVQTTLACGQDLTKVANLTDYNTATDAADVNDLRTALGYDKLNLLGVSYGTRLALEVMRSFPQAVRSVILDSTYPPDVDLYAEAPPNAERAFDELFQGCAADEACNAAYPDLRTVLFDTVAQLNQAPVSFQSPDPFTGTTYNVELTGDDLLGVVFQLLYITDIIPSLPQIIYDASHGDFDLVSRILGVLVAQDVAVSAGMGTSVQCHDEVPFSSVEKFQAALAKVPDLTGLFENSNLGTASFLICKGWGAAQAAATEDQPVTSDLPTLILSGQYDPITPPAWAEHAAATLKNSYLFEYPGVGHGASTVGGCPQDMIIAFLETPTSSPDSSCMTHMGPPLFAVPGQGETAVEMVAFTNQQMGIQGLVPKGWTETTPGVYARGRSAVDATVLLEQAAQVTAADLLSLMVKQLNLAETPTTVGERKANGLTWALYAVEVQGLSVDFALAESGQLGLIVVLQCDPAEEDALYHAAYVPAIDALVPIGQ